MKKLLPLSLLLLLLPLLSFGQARLGRPSETADPVYAPAIRKVDLNMTPDQYAASGQNKLIAGTLLTFVGIGLTTFAGDFAYPRDGNYSVKDARQTFDIVRGIGLGLVGIGLAVNLSGVRRFRLAIAASNLQKANP